MSIVKSVRLILEESGVYGSNYLSELPQPAKSIRLLYSIEALAGGSLPPRLSLPEIVPWEILSRPIFLS